MSEIAADAWTIEPRIDRRRAHARGKSGPTGACSCSSAAAPSRSSIAHTILGKAWIFLRPLVPLFVRVFVFGALLQVGGTAKVPYFLFVAVGTAAWELFASSLMWATRSLQLNGSILARLYVPRLILPIASMVPGLVVLRHPRRRHRRGAVLLPRPATASGTSTAPGCSWRPWPSC